MIKLILSQQPSIKLSQQLSIKLNHVKADYQL